MRGDSDSSGFVSIYDVTCIQRSLAGLEPIDIDDLPAADVDGNGLDINDASEIQRYLAEFGNSHQIGEWVTDVQPTTEYIKPGENELPFIWN